MKICKRYPAFNKSAVKELLDAIDALPCSDSNTGLTECGIRIRESNRVSWIIPDGETVILGGTDNSKITATMENDGTYLWLEIEASRGSLYENWEKIYNVMEKNGVDYTCVSSCSPVTVRKDGELIQVGGCGVFRYGETIDWTSLTVCRVYSDKCLAGDALIITKISESPVKTIELP